jgi:hypothetical protein
MKNKQFSYPFIEHQFLYPIIQIVILSIPDLIYVEFESFGFNQQFIISWLIIFHLFHIQIHLRKLKILFKHFN